MATKNQKQHKNTLQRTRELIEQLPSWNPQKPNWALLNSISDNELIELADLYLVTASDSDKRFVRGMLHLRKLSYKQKFRLICILSRSATYTRN